MELSIKSPFLGSKSMVPTDFLLQILGEDRVTKFVIQEIVSSSMADYVKKALVLGIVLYKSTVSDRPLAYSFVIWVLPKSIVIHLWVLNQIVYELPAEHYLADSRPLRELLGHTPTQVIAGGLLGIITTSIGHVISLTISSS